MFFSSTALEDLCYFDVNVRDYLATRPDFHLLVASVLVFARDTNNGTDKLLLVQRSESDSHPGCWETPGGCIDDNGETILEGAARELKEETGLTAHRFVRYIGRMVFYSGTGRRTKTWLKFHFEAEVEEAAGDSAAGALARISEGIKLSKEHQAWVWATEEEVASHWIRDGEDEVYLKFVNAEQKAMFLNGFARRRRDSIVR